MSVLEIAQKIHEYVYYVVIDHTFLWIAINIESFAIFYMIAEASKRIGKKLIEVKEKVLRRCVDDRIYRNKIASMLFFFADMGPSISSFSIIALFITTEENVFSLTIIFFCGIFMKEIFRGFKNKFYGAIDKRSS